MKKVSLINCNWQEYAGKSRTNVGPFQPLDLNYISAILREKGYETRVYDLNLLKDLKVEKADFFVITTSPSYLFWRCAPLTTKIPLSKAAELKSKFPEAKIILIGPHPTVDEELIKDKNIDGVVRGEPEFEAVKVIKELEEGEEKVSSEIGIVKEMEELPFPDFNREEMGKYLPLNYSGEKKIVATLYEASRGCPYSCTYCFKTRFRKNFRQKSTEKIISELKRLIREYGANYVYFIDENFTANMQKTKEMMREMIKEGLKLEWACQGNAMFMDEELLRLMKEAGCMGIEFGIESGDKEILKNLNKPTDLERTKKMIEATIKEGISPWLFFIIGGPGESLKTLKSTIRFLKQLDLRKVRFSAEEPIPYPTTPLYEQGLKEGKIKSGKIEWEELNKVAGTIGNGLSKVKVRMYKLYFLSFLALQNPSWSIPYAAKHWKGIMRRLFLVN